MRFKRLAEEMSNNEILHVLEMVNAHAQLKSFSRNIQSNFIEIFYSLPRDTENILHQIDLLPDNIYVIDANDTLDGEPIENGDIAWRYLQFTVAKGYSELWIDNPYTDI